MKPELKIKCSFDIDRTTAEICLKVVEQYVNKSELGIEIKQERDGTITLDYHYPSVSDNGGGQE